MGGRCVWEEGVCGRRVYVGGGCVWEEGVCGRRVCVRRGTHQKGSLSGGGRREGEGKKGEGGREGWQYIRVQVSVDE